MLAISVTGTEYSFSRAEEFEFALAGRTCVPAAKVTALSELADEALLREAEGIRAVERRFSDALSGQLEEVTTVSSFLKELEPSLISQDHDWRAIIAALNGIPKLHEAYKKLALVKYMQYLRSRQEVVRTLYANRRRDDEMDEPISAGSTNDVDSGSPLRETVIFDVEKIDAIRRKEAMAFSRIPKGETVQIPIDPNGILELRLARHRCQIIHRGALMFVDEQGRDHSLPPGRSIVGRDASSDIIMNSSFRDVSRKHLILESDGERTIRITDISSHGTSIPPQYLDNTTI